MKLVVVESPAKVKTIEKYLGKGYKVVASKGHVVDLPKSEIGVDFEKDFKPKYVVTKVKALSDLKKAFKGKDGLVLAVDQDREGEAIGWHVARELKLINERGDIINRDKSMARIVFTEITKGAVQEAIKHPRDIDMHLVDAQQARRVLDRVVGYKLSPLIWKKIRYGLSAGRVQSVALRLIVEKEEERDAFDPKEYWQINLGTNLKSSDKKILVNYLLDQDNKRNEKHKHQQRIEESDLIFDLIKYQGKKIKLETQKQVKKIVSKIAQKELKISNTTSKDVVRKPKAPFTTSTMQRAASSRLGQSAKQTMSIAQKLYEKGLITYMRTDSVNLSQTAIKGARSFIKKKFGEKYLPASPKMYSTKSKSAQEAHEAIRPTSFVRKAAYSKLKPVEQKLYDLIHSRALASQMNPAVMKSTSLFVEINEYEFQIRGQKVTFPGFLKAYNQNIIENLLPDLKKGDTIYLEEILSTQKFTAPPARYSEASLIKALENFGIGRPSTYASIISTIIARKYVEKQAKQLVPTDTGIVVNKLLRQNFEGIIDVTFTADIEEQLDNIAAGKTTYKKVLSDFYKPFAKKLEEAEKNIKKEDYTVLGTSDFKCPDCKKIMNIKLGRFGKFLSCPDFPECKGILSIDGKTEEEIAAESQTPAFKKLYKDAPLTKDKRNYLLKRGRYGKFWAHPDYPKVKDARPLELNGNIRRKVYGVAPKAKDGSTMKLRAGRFGEFWAHKKYPKKREVVRINKKEVAEKKKELGIGNKV